MAHTNKEYLTKALSGLSLSEDDIDVILMKAGLEGNGEADIEACDNAIYSRFSVILKAATQNVSEGGYSLSWNVEAVKLYYSALCTELNKPNVLEEEETIRDCSDLW